MADNNNIKSYENYATCNYLAIVFTFLALFLTTVGTSLQSWQKAKHDDDSNYYLNIGMWQWSALAKNNNDTNMCGKINKDVMFPQTTPINDGYEEDNYNSTVLDICRITAIISAGFLTIALLTPLSNNKAGIISAIIFTVLALIVYIGCIILYYTNLYKNADLSDLEEVPIIDDQDWTYGSSLWFNIAGGVFGILAIIMFGISLSKFNKFGDKDGILKIQEDIKERDNAAAIERKERIANNAVIQSTQ